MRLSPSEPENVNMRLLKDVNLNRCTIEPDSSVGEALQVMESQGVRAVGIATEGKILGVLSQEAAILSDPEARVADSMRGALTPLSGEDPIRRAAKALVENQTEHMPVVSGENYLGLISSFTLLGELGQSWDPLTGLSWSDRLREWGMENLSQDREISIVFFDLDDFGQYNKVHGHVVGDQVLKTFTETVLEIIDPHFDVFVRSGGDEFAIGTIRLRDEIDAFLSPLAGRTILVEGLAEPARYSYGISGGKRRGGPVRTNENISATLDNLINIASRESTRNKPKHISQIGATLLPETPEAVHAVQDDFSSIGAEFAAATATKLIEQSYPELRIKVDDIVFHQGDDKDRRLTIFGEVLRFGEVTPFMATCGARGNLTSSITQAIRECVADALAITDGRMA